MQIALTGATGYLGSALLRRLIDGGHGVTALVRSDDAAQRVTAAGAKAALGSLTDDAWLSAQFRAADAVVHTAAGGDSGDEQLNRAVAGAAIRELSGTGRPYVHTSGIWIWGSGADLTEDTPLSPPPITAWRVPIEDELLAADRLAATVLAPGIVYGHGAGIPAGVFGDRTGRLVGDGTQHWATVHVDDLAALYALVLDQDGGVGRLIAAGGVNPAVTELAAAASGGPVTPESADTSRERLGALFADALLLDQQATGAKARELGWTPVAPALTDELARGSYAFPATSTV